MKPAYPPWTVIRIQDPWEGAPTVVVLPDAVYTAIATEVGDPNERDPNTWSLALLHVHDEPPWRVRMGSWGERYLWQVDPSPPSGSCKIKVIGKADSHSLLTQVLLIVPRRK